MHPDSPQPAWELDRYRPLLRLLAWKLHLDPRLRPRFDGSDVVQEVMVRAVTHLPRFLGHTEAEMICWLQEILHNTFRDLVRRELADRRNPEVEASLDAAIADSSAGLARCLACEQSSPSEQAERREVLLRWAEAIEKLPAEQRDVVVLRDQYELPVKRIAELLGRSEKSIAGLLLRGRQGLRRSFPDYQEDGHG